jgi:hypothetical protein
LVFAFLANHEIKRVVSHPKVQPFRFASHNTTESGSSVSATHREQSPLSPHVAFRQKEAALMSLPCALRLDPHP